MQAGNFICVLMHMLIKLLFFLYYFSLIFFSVLKAISFFFWKFMYNNGTWWWLSVLLTLIPWLWNWRFWSFDLLLTYDLGFCCAVAFPSLGILIIRLSQLHLLSISSKKECCFLLFNQLIIGVLIGMVFLVISERLYWRIFLIWAFLKLLFNFANGFKLDLMFLALIENVGLITAPARGFHVLVLLSLLIEITSFVFAIRTDLLKFGCWIFFLKTLILMTHVALYILSLLSLFPSPQLHVQS